MDLGKLSVDYLLLINVLSQRQTFYALSQLQQQSLTDFEQTFKAYENQKM